MTVLFWVIGTLLTLSAVGVVALKNPVYSALSLIANLFLVACLYATLSAHFLAAVQVVVYAGAIMVLFLFVVMLLNLKREQWGGSERVLWGAGVAVVLVFFALTVPVLYESLGKYGDPGTLEGSVSAVGEKLYSDFAFLFQAAGVLIMTSLVAVVLLARKRVNAQQG